MLNTKANPTSEKTDQSAPSSAIPEVPERPALADNVQPIGEMPDTGFSEQQWLILRNAQFVQVSELLYRVVEQIDGNRTLKEIAERMTEATDWLVSEADVRRIIQSKLMPLGLIAAAGETAASTHSALADPKPQPSAMAVNMRMKVIGPQFVNPIAGALENLFNPVGLVFVLAVVTFTHWWLYFRHGVVAGVVEVLYRPWLFLIILAVVLLAAIFHEFGHAAALKYGGGHVRGMGVGFYLIYPAFYTDVTDSYRLGKWARVRTDLGGVYFHLIFAVLVTALYFLTRYEFLLLAIVLIDMEIIRQFIPFVRLDGYWVLADLTGVPDFFSQMGPFLASVLPLRGWKGAKLPQLKPWVRVVFALFIILTIPLLAVLGILMFVGVPNLIATSWDSLLAQFDDFSKAQSAGSFPGMVLAIVEAILLTLPIAATLYLLFVLVLPPMKALWNWSKPTPLRRLLASIVTLGLLALTAALWTPRLAAMTDAGPPGVQTFSISDRAHVEGKVQYAQAPPVGGDHSPIWQNCGFYDTPIANENGVHSMEHGAVWITYRPDLDQKQVQKLRNLAHSQTYVLVSPWQGLPAPVVASAWGKQLQLTSADDPRLERFISVFRLSNQAPERGGQCTDGKGEPK
jgi:putative peptide zinc metalloprotease protein